jgi:hypothetical protein
MKLGEKGRVERKEVRWIKDLRRERKLGEKESEARKEIRRERKV